MAAGDLTVFNEAKAFMVDGGFESADIIKCALITSATVPTASTANPRLAAFTEVAATGSYTAGGVSLGDLGTCVTQSGGTMTFDSTTDPSWAQNASSPATARYAVVYNSTDATGRAFCFIDLGATIDLTAGSLTITWNASGLFTIT